MKREENKDYSFLINQVKNKFPLLKGRKIKVQVLKKPLSDLIPFSAKASWALGLVVKINPKYTIYNDYELTGLFAHELSHLEDWVRRGGFYKWAKCLHCSFSRKFNEKTEKETDKNAIKKGFGKELYAQRLKREALKDKNYEKFKDLYLSSEEIASFLNSNIKLL